MRRVPLLLLLAACAPVWPDYVPPGTGVTLPAALPSAAGFRATQPAQDWWAGLGDPVLAGLVAEALTRNHDLRIASANLRAAGALLDETDTLRQPDTTLTASANRARASNAAQGQTVRAPVLSPTSVVFGASWELDLFGRIDQLS
jgi:outer membrane protein TolC